MAGLGADGLAERPVLVGLAIDASAVLAEEHALVICAGRRVPRRCPARHEPFVLRPPPFQAFRRIHREQFGEDSPQLRNLGKPAYGGSPLQRFFDVIDGCHPTITGPDDIEEGRLLMPSGQGSQSSHPWLEFIVRGGHWIPNGSFPMRTHRSRRGTQQHATPRTSAGMPAMLSRRRTVHAERLAAKVGGNQPFPRAFPSIHRLSGASAKPTHSFLAS